MGILGEIFNEVRDFLDDTKEIVSDVKEELAEAQDDDDNRKDNRGIISHIIKNRSALRGIVKTLRDEL